MNDVVGPPLGHMAIDAAGLGGVAAGGDLRGEGSVMALATNGVIVLHGFAPMPDIVRIVAGGAFERAVTFQEALRGAHPRNRACSFEAAIFIGSGSFVKCEHE